MHHRPFSRAAVDGPPAASANGHGPAQGDPDWREWLDGRPRRLKRGKHYTGDPKAVIRRAREVAAELGRTVVEARDSQGKYEYLWIQFVDGEVKPGNACPRCGGTALEKAQKHFLRCLRCGATLKAADDWEVAVGEFPAPGSSQSKVDATASTTVDDERPAEDYVEILGVRAVSPDGQELDEPTVAEEFVLEVSLRFLRAAHVVLPRVRLSVPDAGPVIRVQPPHPFHPSGPQTLCARVWIPRDLLMPREYTVEVTVLILPDRSRPGDYLRLATDEAFAFRVRKVPSRSIAEVGSFGSPFHWDLDVCGEEDVEPWRLDGRPPDEA